MTAPQPQRAYPLAIWERTPQAQELLATAQARMDELGALWKKAHGGTTYIAEASIGTGGIVRFWFNDFGGGHTSRWSSEKWSFEDARANAVRHGAGGWWRIEDLENLLILKGELYEDAMWKCGFTRRDKNPELWRRRRKEDKKPSLWWHRGEHPGRTPEREEADRLTPLIVCPHDAFDFQRSHSLVVAEGMIYVQLDVNPFGGTTAESLGAFGRALATHGHIAPHQEGFSLEAEEVAVDTKTWIRVIARATPDEAILAEQLWPNCATNETLYLLAESLVAAVNPA